MEVELLFYDCMSNLSQNKEKDKKDALLNVLLNITISLLCYLSL